MKRSLVNSEFLSKVKDTDLLIASLNPGVAQGVRISYIYAPGVSLFLIKLLTFYGGGSCCSCLILMISQRLYSKQDNQITFLHTYYLTMVIKLQHEFSARRAMVHMFHRVNLCNVLYKS